MNGLQEMSITEIDKQLIDGLQMASIEPAKDSLIVFLNKFKKMDCDTLVLYTEEIGFFAISSNKTIGQKFRDAINKIYEDIELSQASLAQ